MRVQSGVSLQHFYPRPPRGGRHAARVDPTTADLFLPTPSARRATRRFFRYGSGHIRISTHALREEGDEYIPTGLSKLDNFYPRPPRGGRLRPVSLLSSAPLFLPTPSARRATPGCCSFRRAAFDFYPRPPRGGRRAGGQLVGRRRRISTHALREEGDDIIQDAIEQTLLFLPTPSARRATFGVPGRQQVYQAFLPTPSARRATGSGLRGLVAGGNFYPRPPRGGRRMAAKKSF